MNIIYLKDGDLNSEEIRLYNERAETRLYHYYEPDPGLFIAETPLVIERAAAAGYEPVSMVGEEGILKETVARLHPYFEKIPLYIGSHELLSEIAGYHLIKGLLCAMRRKPLQSVKDICGSASRIVVLEAVMNPINIGTIFRSAAALGMDGVLLTKGCSDPLYRRSIRVSMGNVFQIPWTFYEEKISLKDRILMLKEMGYYTAAMALKDDSVRLDSEKLSGHEKLAVILGSEYDGLCSETIDVCDAAVRIPMKDGVDSLNVAAASAVAFWELRKK
ncbi:MAG: RNA methyltransferase [Lachnospiraceae bacterium]|nr:RNA methyltransferase [Lachnospiraceae bacterium]